MFATFAKAIVCLALGQSPGDVIYSNSRAQKVEANFPESRRAEIRELLLFASQNQGENWEQVSKISPEQRTFEFGVPVDGSYWLRVAVVNRNGEQEPRNLYKVQPNWKLLIDTLKPLVKLAPPMRNGNEVTVGWEIREDHPEWSTFRLEYMTSPNGIATPIGAAPGLTGSAKFNANTNGPMVVRLVLRDKAGNESIATAEVGGREGFAAAPAPPINNAPITLPGTITASAPPPQEISTALAQASALPVTPPPPIQPLMQQDPIAPPPLDHGGIAMPGNPGARTHAPATTHKTLHSQPPTQLAPVDSSRWQTPTAPVPPPAPLRPIASSLNTVQQVQYQTPAAPTIIPRKPLPTLQYVNSPEVVLEYELSKVGPSGVGSVDIYMTQDDGQNWEHVVSDPAVIGKTTGGRHQGILELPGDGIYGFSLVVKSQAQLKQDMANGEKKAKGPRGGDAPEIRVEVDTNPPTAELFSPSRDTTKANALMLIWTAADKNLGTNPVTLEWAERREGPWSPIATNIANSGKHSWQLPDRLPVQVYMRLRVKDLAGNEGVAVTPDPQLVDLSEPEGRLVNVTVPPRR